MHQGLNVIYLQGLGGKNPPVHLKNAAHFSRCGEGELDSSRPALAWGEGALCAFSLIHFSSTLNYVRFVRVLRRLCSQSFQARSYKVLAGSGPHLFARGTNWRSAVGTFPQESCTD